MLLIIADRYLVNGFLPKGNEADQETVKPKTGKTKKQRYIILLLIMTNIG